MINLSRVNSPEPDEEEAFAFDTIYYLIHPAV